MVMTSSTSGGDLTTTSSLVATIPTNPITTRPSAVTTSSPVRPVASMPQLPAQLQLRSLPFLLHTPQLQPPHRHPHITNQQQHGAFIAQSPIQTHTQNQTRPRQQLSKVSEPILYPLASSGRGLIPAPRGIKPARRPSLGIYPHPPATQTQHQHVQLVAPSDSFQRPQSTHMIHPSYQHPSHCNVASVSVSAAAPAAVGGVGGISLNPQAQAQAQAQPKAVSLPRSVPESNGQKDLLDKGEEDTYVIVRDRKVRISDGASIYGLCRSWLRNGYPEESQPQYGDVMRSLPKPSPNPVGENLSPKRKESDDETDAEENAKSVENLSTKELLQTHIKQAKKVRARLREERLQRIERYKGRLALLLPPLVEQSRNETTTGT